MDGCMLNQHTSGTAKVNTFNSITCFYTLKIHNVYNMDFIFCYTHKKTRPYNWSKHKNMFTIKHLKNSLKRTNKAGYCKIVTSLNPAEIMDFESF